MLHVCAYEVEGGAARAAHRLHRGLIGRGVDSRMLVQKKQSDDVSVVGPDTDLRKARAIYRPLLDRLPARLYRGRSPAPFSTGLGWPSGLVNRVNALEPDVVHLHWINDGAIGIRDLARIEAPIVWTLHDMWPFTGGCHYASDCDGYLVACGNCPALGSGTATDLSRVVFGAKRRTYDRLPGLTIVAPSRWMAESARRSRLLGRFPIHSVPYLIDLDAFSPVDQETARRLLGLPAEGRLLLFGAVSATEDRRKGFAELIDALRQVEDDGDHELVVFGRSSPSAGSAYPMRTRFLGRVGDQITLRLLYSAADVMVVPSLEENFANTIIESLSCGTPVVCFDIGGNTDMVRDGVSGAVAREVSASGLAGALRRILAQSDLEPFRRAARESALRMFDPESVTDRMLRIYQDALQEPTPAPSPRASAHDVSA